MRFVHVEAARGQRLGVRVTSGVMTTAYADLRAFLEAGEGARAALEAEIAESPRAVAPDRLLTPLADRCQIIATGGNYRDHLAEVGLTVSEPVFFPKLWSSVAAPGAPIRMPSPTTELDYEVELAVVVGRSMHRVTEADALEYVFGYTVINDVSARDVMTREPLQIMLCKSADSFCPVAPDIVTADEVDLDAAIVSCSVDGEIRQRAHARDMIHGVAELLAFLTRTVTLSPGDVVTTGTPGGSAVGRPDVPFLRPENVVEAAVSGVGSVVSRVERDW